MSELSSLLDLVRRRPPAPWRDGENIPWHEPGFSRRMLAEHLSQEHDLASRRAETIDAQVDWIHGRVLESRPTRILDLGCGPGLYTSRLARRGHECVGIDYSPASIAHAQNGARRESLACEYWCEDIRKAEYGTGFGLVMLIFGEFNSFPPQDARGILRKANRALAEGGVLLLEPHTADAIRGGGGRRYHWYSAESGLFSGRPHLCLQERSWDPSTNAATTRYFVIDAATGDVTVHAQTQQAYSADEYHSVLSACGFDDAEFFPSLTGAAADSQVGLIAIVARNQSPGR